MKYSFVVLCGLFFLGCTESPKVVFENKGYQNVVWSDAEKQQNIAIKHLARSKYSSSHLLRIKGAELPHYHDEHDLTVTIVSGKSVLHFKNHEVVLKAGDVVNIAKGTYHWAENVDSEASVVFATFSPPYKGKDKRLVP